MADFDPSHWHERAAAKLKDIKAFNKDNVYLAYGSIAGLTLWPLVEAAVQSGQWQAVLLSLYTVAGGVGANLVAEQLQRWRDRSQPPTEAEVVSWAQEAAADADLRQALDDVLVALAAIPQAGAGLSQDDKRWLMEKLQQELAALGNLARFQPVITQIMAVGDRSVAVSGSVGGPIITGEHNQLIERQIVYQVNKEDIVAGAPHQLPASVNFIGRDEEIIQLKGLLRTDNNLAIAAVNGLPGVGKTELVNRVAYDLQMEYSDAQLFVDLRGTDARPREPADALAFCIRSLTGWETELPKSLEELVAQYRSLLFNRRALIVLDNAADEAQIRPLQPPANCALLITSRNALPLPGFTLNELSPAAGSTLLRNIAGRIPQKVANDICGLCGNLPLALRIAGWLLAVRPDLDPAEYAAQLQVERDRLEMLSTPDDQLSVKASFNLSYKFLEEDLRRVFCQLAVFPETFTAEAAETITLDPGHVHLSALVTRNLVQYDLQDSRYHLHDLMRLFSREKLKETSHADEVADVKKRMVNFFKSYARKYKEDPVAIAKEQRNIEEVCWLASPRVAARIILNVTRPLCRFGSYELVTKLKDNPRFEAEVCKLVKRQAGTKRIVVFLGAGDLAREMMQALGQEEKKDGEVICVAVDGKISVGWMDADYQFLKTDLGLRDTEWLKKLLHGLMPSSSPDGESAYPNLMLVGEYHGFDVDKVFTYAEREGYRVIPSIQAASAAMDKIRFWQTFQTAPGIQTHLLPQVLISRPIPLRGKDDHSDQVEFDDTDIAFLEEVYRAVDALGLPCVFKPAISEFGYGQSIVREKERLIPALHTLIEQTHERRVNPTNQFIVQQCIDHTEDSPRDEVMQVIVRHLDLDGHVHTTCLPLIWSTVVYKESGGPFVFENSFQHAQGAPDRIQQNSQMIEALSGQVIDWLDPTRDTLGVYGVELFLKDGQVWFNRLNVRTQDTALVTQVTDDKNNCFRLFAKTVLRKPINPSHIREMQYSGAVRAILWKLGEKKLFREIEGWEEAEKRAAERHVKFERDEYKEKIRLRLHRRMGTVRIQAPLNITQAELEEILAYVCDPIRIVPNEEKR